MHTMSYTTFKELKINMKLKFIKTEINNDNF